MEVSTSIECDCAFVRLDGECRVRRWGDSYSIVDVSRTKRVAICSLRDEERVRACARLCNRIRRLVVQEDSGAIADVNVDVPERRREGCIP